jgi:hypothetical protein
MGYREPEMKSLLVKREGSLPRVANRRFRFAVLLFGALTTFLVSPHRRLAAQDDQGVQQLHESFAHPPPDSRILMRWWWFGPSATKDEIKRELEQMKDAGIGGVEIATLYPLQLDDAGAGFRNLPFLSDEHLETLRFANQQAQRLSLRVDLTLGSGWPFGGPHIPIQRAAGRLRVEAVPVQAEEKSVAVPSISAGEELVAIFLAPRTHESLDDSEAQLLQNPHIDNGRLQFANVHSGPKYSVVFFISSRTGMMVKRPSVGAEGFVLDHYDPAAIAAHLRAVGDRLMTAFSDQPPYAVFSDSLEDYGSNWTPDLLGEFERRRGYDLTPHLVSLVASAGAATSDAANSAAIRRDWGKTLTELVDERFLSPLRAWAQAHHTLLRSQTYGFPPVTLSSNQLADLPEGEGKASMNMWRQFSDTRWAASAGHLFDRNVISSETWTWLHSPAFRATPLDMKAEADLHFLQGINQLVGHGWPYSPKSAGEPGWRMYAAGAFNAHNPWWFVVPELSAYLQRVSFALRLGKPANDVALLLPNDDAWASFCVPPNARSVTVRGGFPALGEGVSIDESMPKLLGDNVIPQILDAGFNFDFIDADAIDRLDIHYPILVLPNVTRIPLATYQKIENYAQHGGIVIATGRPPSTAPGFLHAADESAKIQQISQRLFARPGAKGHFVKDDTQLGGAIASHLQPDVHFVPRTPEIGFIHRRLRNGDLYFLANTGNRPRHFISKFRSPEQNGEWWNPFTGETETAGESGNVAIDLQPYESRLLFIGDSVSRRAAPPPRGAIPQTIDLSADWDLSFSGSNQTLHMDVLHSWSDEAAFRYFSGEATYRKTFDIPADKVGGSLFMIDFGEATPLDLPNPLPQFNMRAYLDPPIREVARVFIDNGLVGSLWHPPYKLNVTDFVHPGKNNLRIVVGNTAMNEMSGKALPDDRLLNQRYGERFIPQDMDKVQPQPSGILGSVRLLVSPRTNAP